MKSTIAIRRALGDPNLLGNSLAGLSWRAWFILLIAMMGEALTDEEREIFKQLTGREREPLQRVDEFVAVVGRRGGKSRAMAILACFIAALCVHEALVAGERGMCFGCAQSASRRKSSLDYAEATFEHSPILRQLIANRTQRYA